MSRALRLSRYIVLLGVVVGLCVATVLFLAVLAHLGLLVRDALDSLGDRKSLKLLGVDSIELVDLVLIATALYIVSIGLYIVFIGPVRLPGQLRISSLDDLKEKLISVVVVVLGVSFLSQVATWDGVRDLLPFGAAIGAVILALSAFSLVRLKGQEHGVAEVISERDEDGHPDRNFQPAAAPQPTPVHHERA